MVRPRDRRQGGRAPRLRRVAGSVLIAALGVASVGATPAYAEQNVRKIGYLRRDPGQLAIGASGNIIIEPAARRAYQAIISNEPNDHTVFRVYDLDTMRIVKVVDLPPFQGAFTNSGPVEWMWTLDAKHRRLFVFIQGAAPETGSQDAQLLVVDLETLVASEPRSLWPAGSRIPLSISYHEGADRLYLMTRLPVEQFARSGVFLEERAPDGTLTWDREYRLGACYGARDHQYPPSVARSVLQPDRIYLNCYSSGAVQGLVIRVHLGADGRPVGEDDVFPALPGPLSTMFDPGSDRMFFMTTNGGAGRGVWVFDGLRSAFLGVVASGDESATSPAGYSMGLDPSTGRLYMQTALGLFLVDARRTPLPAGLPFRELAFNGIGSIQVDPLTHRVFVLDPASASQDGSVGRYLVLADGVRSSRDPPAGDPDSLTTDVAERAGITSVNFSAGGRAFGLRSLTAGGLQKYVWNVALGQFAPDQPGVGAAWTAMSTVPVDAGNRDVYLARVRSVALTNDSADASALAVDADGGTARDVESTGQAWPFSVSECHNTGASEPGAVPLSGVTCDVKSRSVFASAGAVSAGEAAVLSVRSLAAGATSWRDAARGVVSRAWGVAHGITIAERVWIGTLATHAETWARGRKGSAGATFDRVIADVRVDSDGDGRPDYSCSQCDPAAVQSAVNRALGGQATIELPAPDGRYYPVGSPGGYQAVIEKQRFRSYSERALNDDDGPEVVGLQLVTYADARAGRSRQVVQIAGVQAESHYGIYVLPQDEGAPQRPIAGIVAPPPVVPTTAPPVVAEPVADRRSTPSPGSSIERVLRRVATGVGILIGSPYLIARLAVLWAFLALPVYLVVRRRALR